MIVYLYVIATHTSMALMELAGWVAAVYGVGYALFRDHDRLINFIRLNKWLLAAMAGLTFWVGISLLATPLLKPFWMQFGFMRWTLLLFGLTQAVILLWSPDFEKKLKYVWLVVFAVTGLYATLQMFTGMDFVRPGRGLVNPQGGGLYKAIGFFSMSLTFAYVFGLSAFTIVPRFRDNVRWLVILGLIGALGILSSMSRGAWISATLVVSFYLAAQNRKLFWPFLAGLVVAVLAASQLDDAIGHKILQLAGLREDNSSHMRIDLWRGYWQMFLDHPLFGVGIFEGDKLLAEYFARLGIDQPFHSHAHNIYLQFLAGTGVFGLLLYGYIAFVFLKMAWELRNRDRWGWGLFLAQVFLHIGALTEANFIDGEVNHMLMLIWALTWARRSVIKVAAQATAR